MEVELMREKNSQISFEIEDRSKRTKVPKDKWQNKDKRARWRCQALNN